MYENMEDYGFNNEYYYWFSAARYASVLDLFGLFCIYCMNFNISSFL